MAVMCGANRREAPQQASPAEGGAADGAISTTGLAMEELMHELAAGAGHHWRPPPPDQPAAG